MPESRQKTLSRVRSPRIHIYYEVETEGAVVVKTLVFTIGIIGDFTGTRQEEKIKPYHERQFVFVDQDNFNDFMKSCNARVDFSTTILGELIELSLKFESMDDFSPLQIIKQIEPLHKIFVSRNNLVDLKTRVSNNGKLFEVMSQMQNGANASLDSIKFQTPEIAQYVQNLIEEFKSLIGPEHLHENPIITIQNIINFLDGKLNTDLDNILHHEHFQSLESSWRGLHYLIRHVEIGESIKLRVLNATYKEIYDDLNKAIEFDQSFLFKKLYEEEYGTYGGNPFSVLGIDWQMHRSQKDFNFLTKLSEVVACAHIPTVLGVHSSVFDISDYTSLHTIRDVAKIFDSRELAELRRFRELEDSRYIAFVLPSFMGRIPYGPNTEPLENLNYTEIVDSHNKFLWVNSMYAYIQRIGDAYGRYGWCAAIVGPENGGVVDNLPIYTYKTEDGDILMKCPTETTVTDRRERELSKQGFNALCHSKDNAYSVFFSSMSANKPLKFDTDIANANAELSARFQYMLNVSRFAHYIKCIMRDKIGSFATKESLVSFLNRWIARYVLLNETSDQEIKARYPLKEAKVVVDEDPARPGCFRAIIYLRPHFQMEELTVSLRLVSRIPEVK